MGTEKHMRVCVCVCVCVCVHFYIQINRDALNCSWSKVLQIEACYRFELYDFFVCLKSSLSIF